MANIPHVEKTIIGPLMKSLGSPNFQSKPRRNTVIKEPTSNPALPGVTR